MLTCKGELQAAGVNINALLAELKILAAEQLSYDYEASLVNMDTKLVLDRVRGKLYRSGTHYLDSNDVQINMRDARYTLSIDNSKKLAYVTNIRNLEKKMNGHLPDKPFDLLNLDALAKANLLHVSEKSDAEGNRTILLSLKHSLFSSLEIRVKTSGEVERVVMKQPVSLARGNRVEKIIVLTHFSNANVSGLINTARYLIQVKDGYRLKEPFTSYKTSALI